MRRILIISPHFPPSNLAAVHRSRLFAQHLPSYGWEPVILTVDEKYYEESLDHHLVSILPKNLRVEKVKAFGVTRPRLVGDIGMRGFFQLYQRAKEIIERDKIDFLYIPIPSFYVALLGRWLHQTTGIRYGIDYIDPWVHHFPGSDKVFSRHWFSRELSKMLEPIAIKRASLITGVAQGYYTGVIERNPWLVKTCLFGAMPYGGESSDHAAVKTMQVKPYLFAKKEGVIQLVYAGAMLPKAYLPLEAVFQSIQKNEKTFQHIEFHFIGTGKSPIDPQGYNIKPLAEKYGLWEKCIFEYPKRIPYLDVLIHLNAADGIFILGSTEPHYTPSKVYQGVLSEKPILAVLHKNSSAVQVLNLSHAGMVLAFDGEEGVAGIRSEFSAMMEKFLEWLPTYSAAQIDKQVFEKYSAKSITGVLAELLDKVVD